MPEPITHNITIYKGNDYESDEFLVRDKNGNSVDISLWGVKSQCREKEARDSTLICDFTVNVSDVDGVKVFTISLTDTETGEIEAKKGFYDILLTDPDGFDFTYVKGAVTFTDTVTDKTDI